MERYYIQGTKGYNFTIQIGLIMNTLKEALNDVRADRRCRIIAMAIAKTNYRAAVEYALGFTLRSLIEKGAKEAAL